MAVERDSSPYGSQTLQGPGWPNVDEEQLTAAAASYQKIAAKISGTVVPQQTSQLSKLQGGWEGTASLAASGEATSMIGGHETNGLQAQAISTALMKMAATVAETKTIVNAAAQEVQAEVEAIAAQEQQLADDSDAAKRAERKARKAAIKEAARAKRENNQAVRRSA